MELLNEIRVSLAQPTLQYPEPDLVMFYKMLETRDIWLDTEIDWDNCAFIVQYIQYLNKHEADNLDPIRLHIMSNGGELTAMFTLYNTIKNSKIPVHTINEGAAHSAAFIVYLAGTIRTMNPDAVFIAHEGSGGALGTFRESKSAMKQYEIEVDRMAHIIAENTNLSVEEINHNYDQNSDWYIRYEDAKRFGILTE